MHLRYRIQFSILGLFFIFATKAQDVNSVIPKIFDTRLNQIVSVAPSDTIYSDLQVIKDAIGNARIVMLGEQDHGDAASFLAKTRLVKYLHKECGFDVLAFESDFYSLNMLSYYSDKKISDIKSICANRNVYPIWTNCKQNEELFNYLNTCLNTDNPMFVTGFDCRHVGAYAKANYIRQFDSILKFYKLPFQQTPYYNEFIQILTDVLNKEYKSKIAEPEQKKFLQYLTTLIIEKQRAGFRENDFWTQELLNLKAFVQNAWLTLDLLNGYSSNIRDKQMSDNLLWLMNNQFPNKKIIVWAHNFHISQNINLTEANKKKDILTMGAELKAVLKDSVYILGFDSYQGTSGAVGTNPVKIKKSSENSLENFIYQKNYDYAFLNFKDLNDPLINRKISFKMKAYLHQEMNGQWLNVFDGIFYIKEMFPCKECDFR